VSGRERRGEGAAAVVKGVKKTVYPDPPAVYSKDQISGVSGLRAGVSGQSGVSGPWAGDSGSP